MKTAVSVSIGSSTRDKAVEIKLLGERVRIERIGTDGDMEAAAGLFRDLDGKVDAFGVGGADLSIVVDGHAYPLYSAQAWCAHVRKTPYVDGAGLKNTLEHQLAGVIERSLRATRSNPSVPSSTSGPTAGECRAGFTDAGYECLFGDLMFALGLNVPLRSLKAVKRVARLLLPVVGRIPIAWLYPTGKDQEKRTPRSGFVVRLGVGDRRRRARTSPATCRSACPGRSWRPTPPPRPTCSFSGRRE